MSKRSSLAVLLVAGFLSALMQRIQETVPTRGAIRHFPSTFP
jgi:hypothetical protein